MTPPIAVGDPVRLLPRLHPKDPRLLPLYDGIVQALVDDRAWVRWSDGARSSVRLQFLDRSIGAFPQVARILKQSADLHDRDRRVESAIRGLNSAQAHLLAAGLAVPGDEAVRMLPSELED